MNNLALQPPAETKPLVLIVDDNPDIVDFIQSSLEHDFQVITATDGEDALAKADEFSPQVVVSDLMMPGMNGITLCRRIKSNPRAIQTSIILLTAKNDLHDKVEGIQAGADLYLTKPFEVEFLITSIHQLIRRYTELVSYLRSELISTPNSHAIGESEEQYFVRKVKAIMDANISNIEFGVETLSSDLGISPTHLYRKLKASTDFSANELIKKYRIKKAALLLLNREGNVSEIMYQVGFSNLSYFSKCFKAEFGISPKGYQQQFSIRQIQDI